VQLAMPVGGENQARAFYGELLGLEEVAKPAALARRGGCWFVGPGVDVHIGVDEDFRPARKAHVAFVVDDVAGFRRRLGADGISTIDDQADIGVERFYTDDPFGNRLEFMAREAWGFTAQGRNAPASRLPTDV
jgi:catechol 2,3-dioxygenase-like lactoylglutathione lyase family enzyme